MSKPIFSTLPTGDFVLASASATRAKLLEDAGLGFCQYPVSIDEGRFVRQPSLKLFRHRILR